MSVIGGHSNASNNGPIGFVRTSSSELPSPLKVPSGMRGTDSGMSVASVIMMDDGKADD